MNFIIATWPVGDEYSDDGLIALLVFGVAVVLIIGVGIQLVHAFDAIRFKLTGKESLAQLGARLDREYQELRAQVRTDMERGVLVDLLDARQQQAKIDEEVERQWGLRHPRRSLNYHG